MKKAALGPAIKAFGRPRCLASPWCKAVDGAAVLGGEVQELEQVQAENKAQPLGPEGWWQLAGDPPPQAEGIAPASGPGT